MKTKNFFVWAALACLLVASGCYDLETEIRILPDGSGFLTGWVKVDRRDAVVATAIGGHTLNQEIGEAVANLQRATQERKGVDLLDSAVYEEGEKTVLRYRFVFDNVNSLNNFWTSAIAAGTPILLANAKMEFTGGTGKCGSYFTRIKVEKREPEKLFVAKDPTLARLDDATYRMFLEKIFSGHFRLRVVPPGDVSASDAPVTDVRGLPVYEKTLFELFSGGLEARVKTNLSCDKPETVKEEGKGVTLGPAPAASDVVNVMQALPLLTKTTVELTQSGRNSADLTVEIDAEPAMKDAIEFYLPVLFGAFPGSMSNMVWSAAKTEEGNYRYRFTSKKAINFKDLKSPLIFLGKDNLKNVFRMQIPEFPYAKIRPADSAARTIMIVKVNLADEIVMTNATEHGGKSATWVVTDQMLRNKVTLEALTK